MSAAASAREPEVRLENFLPHRLAVVAEAISRALERACARRYGITLGEWRVLASVGQIGPAAAKDVCRHASMHKTKVSRAAAALEHRGLLGRQTNPADLREAILSLTASGEAALAAMAEQARGFASRLEAALTPADHLALDRILDRLGAAVITPDARTG